MAAALSPLVSIIIPVFNGADFLRTAIDGALAQTYPACEVIVVNDGSTDGTEAIAASYGARVRYFAKVNGGVSTALNLGLAHARGDYISWLSHDDMYTPDKVARQVAALAGAADPARTVVYSDFRILDLLAGTEADRPVPPDYGTSESVFDTLRLLLDSRLHGCALLLPARAFAECGGFRPELRTIQDYERWLAFLRAGYVWRYCKGAVVLSRQHAGQDSRKKQALCRAEARMLIRLERRLERRLFPEALAELARRGQAPALVSGRKLRVWAALYRLTQSPRILRHYKNLLPWRE
ncbi:hypothetical protein FACS1894186_0690 [Alphaproteobacteria bacterium]|nr:hypothetical protein FACS1894186_0690 [Alphaproteobacteria bacterium]